MTAGKLRAVWPVIERAWRYGRAAYVDLRLFLTGKFDPELPPLRLRFVGAGDFRAVGEHLLDLTISRGCLKPDSRLLDVGCGAGRLAIPLTRFLRDGAYEGFDVVAPATRWCRRHITPRHPHFRFRHVSLRNSEYSLRGSTASRFVFPYEGSQFDCVVAYSLFTHLRFEEIRNYLEQSYRVLAPGGRLVATFFLLNEHSESAQKALPSVHQFPYGRGGVRVERDSNPGFAVAIDEGVLRDLLGQAGFRDIVVEPGSWYGIQNAPTFQDLVTCSK